MTDTAVATPVADVPAFVPDALATELLSRLGEPFSKAKIAKAAIKSDPHAVLVELYEKSTEPAIVKIREQVEALRAKADEMLRPQLDANAMSKEDAEQLLRESVKTVKSLVDAGETIRPGFATWAESQIEGLDTVAKTRGSASSGTSNQSGVSRPRVRVQIDGTQYEKFTDAAKALSIPTVTLHEGWTKAAGKSAKDITETVSFDFTVVGKDGSGDKTHKVVVTKK